MSRTLTKTLICGACAYLLAVTGLTARAAAGTLQIDPVKLEISKDRKTASLSVRNDEKTPVTIRAYPLTWSQADGTDVHEESSAVIVSPPIFTIPAGATQVVRVGLRTPAAADRAYRLIVEEVPEADASTGVRVALRLDLPLYAMISTGSLSDLSWSTFKDAKGRWVAEAVNRGQGYVRVEPEQVGAATGVRVAGISFGTVLPGSRRRWPLGEQPDITDRARFQALVRTTQGGQTQLAKKAD